MSGLDPETCHILEIATIITDHNLEILAEGPDLVIHQPDAVLDAMDEWCTTHHGESGLTQSVRDSNISLEDAAKIQQKANELGKADYNWDCELKDANGQVVAVSSNRYQLRRMNPAGA